MDEILNKNYSRKTFFIIVGLILLALVFIRYLVLPNFNNDIKTGFALFLANTFDGLIVSMLVTVFIGSFLYFLKPKNINQTNIEIVEPRALPELFEKAFPATEIWWYKGGCGRYFRTKSLPAMAEWARKSSSSRAIKAVILDPSNLDLCESHAIFRKSTASASLEAKSWDIKKVRCELYATIVTTLVIQREEHMLNIDLSLSSQFSTFRIDLSDAYAIITKEDRKAPAILCRNQSYYYKSYKDEIVLCEKQCKRVSRLNSGDYSVRSLTGRQVREILEAVNIDFSGMLDEDFQNIANICTESKNPYA